jgi:WD40 repeat protein
LDIWDAGTGQRIWDPDQSVPYPLAEFQQKKEDLLRKVSDQRLSKRDAEADLKLLLLLRDVRKDEKRLIVRGALQTHCPSYFSPDGSWLVTRDGIMVGSDYSSEAVIWDAKRCQPVCEFYEDDTWVEPFIFSSDGSRFLRRAYETPRQIYESATGQPVREFPELPNAGCLALAPDGKRAVLGTRREAVLFDTDSGRLIKNFTVPGSSPRQAEFSPNGERVAIEFQDHSVDRLNSEEFRDRVNVYEISDLGKELFSLEPPTLAHRYRWYPAAYNADGTRLLYGGALWHAASGNKIRQFRIVYDLPSE